MVVRRAQPGGKTPVETSYPEYRDVRDGRDRVHGQLMVEAALLSGMGATAELRACVAGRGAIVFMISADRSRGFRARRRDIPATTN